MHPTIAAVIENKAIVQHIQRVGTEVNKLPSLSSHQWKGVVVIECSVQNETTFILDTLDVYAWSTGGRFHITRGTIEQHHKIFEMLSLIK